MKIAVRVDASCKIGLGHIVRCLSLAEELRSLGAKVLFVARSLDVDMGRIVSAQKFPICILPAAEAESGSSPTGRIRGEENDRRWQIDADETVDVLASFGPDWIIVDHYSLDDRWHSSVARRMKAQIAAIDDLADRNLNVDVLVDHNICVNHRERYAGFVADRTRVLGGPRFALLGTAFRGSVAYRFNDSVRSIGIFMGGTDADDFSSVAVRACREIAGFKGPIEVATTRYNPNLLNLRRMAMIWPLTRIIEDLPDLADFFSRHDMQVGAGGGATWERAAVGAPSLLLIAAENQRESVYALAALGAVASLEKNRQCSVSNVGEAIGRLIANSAFRRKLSDSSKILVDGFGTRRVALCLLKDKVRVRSAEYRDADMILGWRNHSSVRSVSRESMRIDAKAHARWMKTVLADTGRQLLIGHVAGVDVGVIRFDALSAQCMEVSLYLDPNFQGLGLGPAMLRAGEAHVSSSGPARLQLVATVLEGNAPSRRLFESNDYSYVNGRWEKTLNSSAENQGGSC